MVETFQHVRCGERGLSDAPFRIRADRKGEIAAEFFDEAFCLDNRQNAIAHFCEQGNATRNRGLNIKIIRGIICKLPKECQPIQTGACEIPIPVKVAVLILGRFMKSCEVNVSALDQCSVAIENEGGVSALQNVLLPRR